jgi:hypothetical protein
MKMSLGSTTSKASFGTPTIFGGSRRHDPPRDLSEDIARAILRVHELQAPRVQKTDEAAERIAIPEIFVRRFSDVGKRNARGGINTTQMVLLQQIMLLRKPGSNVVRVATLELVKRMGFTDRNVRKNLQELEDRGLIQRLAHIGEENGIDLTGVFNEIEHLKQEEESHRALQLVGGESK